MTHMTYRGMTQNYYTSFYIYNASVPSKTFLNSLSSLFYRYMAQTTLTLFVLGSALETSVDICDINTVHDANGSHDVSIGLLKIDHLKKLIWNIIKESEENINKAIRLELWKVEIPRDDKELVLLNEMF